MTDNGVQKRRFDLEELAKAIPSEVLEKLPAPAIERLLTIAMVARIAKQDCSGAEKKREWSIPKVDEKVRVVSVTNNEHCASVGAVGTISRFAFREDNFSRLFAIVNFNSSVQWTIALSDLEPV